MQTHNLKRNTKNRKKVQVGRGGRRGKTSGRGTKGQKARAGRKLRPEIRDRIKKLPKLRGYRFNSFGEKPLAVNLSVIDKAYKEGESVNLVSLREKNIVRSKNIKSVKVLGQGEITKKVIIENLPVSATAKEKIEKAGGSIKA